MIEELGLSQEDKNTIIEEVEVILNSAASVNFDDPLKQALSINYFGAKRMLDLAKLCPKLKVFSHVSTCYVPKTPKPLTLESSSKNKYNNI